MMHTTGFEMIGEFSYDDLGMFIFELFFCIILIISVLCFDVIMIYGIYALIYKISVIIRTKEVKRKKVALKMPITRHHSEEYNVKVEYDGVSEIFDDCELFKKYKEDDDISLILIQRLDKNGKIIEQELEMSE